MPLISNFIHRKFSWCLFSIITCLFSKSSLAENLEAKIKVGLLIPVNRINLIGNTIFSDRELIDIITPLENQQVTLERLLQVRTEITDHYINEGYIATGAFIPPQKLDSGELKIIVIEGKLSKTEFVQKNILNKAYISSRLPQNDSVLNIKALQSALSKLQKSPLIESINGEIFFDNKGNIQLLLDVQETSRFTRDFNITNTFSPSIGRLGGESKIRLNALGIGDIFELGFTKTQGLNRFSTLYSLPINQYNTQLTIQYITADSELITEELEELDINGNFSAYLLTLNQPLLFEGNQQLNFKIGLSVEESESFILDDFSFSFVDGIDDGLTEISELSFTQEYSKQGLNNSFLLSSTFNVGANILEPTITTSGRDGLYWNWVFQSQSLFRLSSNLNWLSDLKIQLSPDNLLPSKQFGLGGVGSVRGYNRNLILGNNGISISNELQMSVSKSSTSDLKAIGFMDAGRIWSSNGNIKTEQNLISLGLGFQYFKSEFLNLNLYYAFPLMNIDNISSESSSSNLSFSIKFFK